MLSTNTASVEIIAGTSIFLEADRSDQLALAGGLTHAKRDDLVAIINDETLRYPLTMMPPFGRNRILTEKEINAVVDFLQTL